MPDGKSIMKMEPGITDSRIYQALEWLYFDQTIATKGRKLYEPGYLTDTSFSKIEQETHKLDIFKSLK